VEREMKRYIVVGCVGECQLSYGFAISGFSCPFSFIHTSVVENPRFDHTNVTALELHTSL
jgi:hypothetical protein